MTKPDYFALADAVSFWKRGSFRSGSNIGSSRFPRPFPARGARGRANRSEPLSAVRFRSACRAHASCVNELLGPMINLPAVASSIFVNVKPLVLRSGNRRRRQTDFVFYPRR
jgi:hypothetical protein